MRIFEAGTMPNGLSIPNYPHFDILNVPIRPMVQKLAPRPTPTSEGSVGLGLTLCQCVDYWLVGRRLECPCRQLLDGTVDVGWL